MVIHCGFCGADFEEDRGQPTCRSCPLEEGCGFIRCPECGYENIAAPRWLTRLTRLTARRREPEVASTENGSW